MLQKGAPMTISSALNAGVSGLNANATRIATISDNIANSATHGYKRVETDFNSLVIDSPAGYAAGGVRTSTRRLIGEQGPLISTGNATDIAVTGRGMLPVTSLGALDDGSELPLLLTTTGSFRANEEGYLVSETGLVLTGVRAGDDGAVPVFPRDTAGGLEPIQVNASQFEGRPTTAITLGANLPATETAAGAAGTPQSLSVEYFDNMGAARTLGITFTPTVPAGGSSNEWTMAITDSASAGATIGEYVLTFDTSRASGGTLASVATISGGPYDPATGTLDLAVDGGPMALAIGRPGDPRGMSQLSDTFAPTRIEKNGTPVGSFSTVEIDSQGLVHAVFDNGASEVIYQVPLADVPDPNGLITQDNQTYAVSADSGPFFLWDAGDGPTGTIQPFSLEGSATDLAAELTRLIETQRAYSSNATVIQTVDEMLQETTDLKR